MGKLLSNSTTLYYIEKDLRIEMSWINCLWTPVAVLSLNNSPLINCVQQWACTKSIKVSDEHLDSNWFTHTIILS